MLSPWHQEWSREPPHGKASLVGPASSLLFRAAATEHSTPNEASDTKYSLLLQGHFPSCSLAQHACMAREARWGHLPPSALATAVWAGLGHSSTSSCWRWAVSINPHLLHNYSSLLQWQFPVNHKSKRSPVYKHSCLPFWHPILCIWLYLIISGYLWLVHRTRRNF